jgi:hypothetical protein
MPRWRSALPLTFASLTYLGKRREPSAVFWAGNGFCPPLPSPFSSTGAGGPSDLGMRDRIVHGHPVVRFLKGRLLLSSGFMRTFQDDLFGLNAARLRAMGVISPDAETAVIVFGEGDGALRREVKVWHRRWSHGRGISLFICPKCEHLAQILRLHDGAPQCRKCLMRQGVQFRITHGTRAERAEARARRIEKLRAKLNGGPLRLHPREGRDIERRRPLEWSLRRALIAEREGLLEEVERWDGPTTK